MIHQKRSEYVEKEYRNLVEHPFRYLALKRLFGIGYSLLGLSLHCIGVVFLLRPEARRMVGYGDLPRLFVW